MDFLFGGGAAQSSQPSLAGAAVAAAAAGPAASNQQYDHDLQVISAASSSTPSALHFGAIHHDQGPILYDNLNRTSAIDDLRSVVIYIFILAIFLSFFLILPGIRNEKLPTFLCITTSLLVGSIIIIGLNGTTWHVGEAPISAPYKAFSRDRIQGDLSVRIGLQSVNISLKAHKYYILHATNGPMIMENVQQSFSLLQQPLLMMMMAQPASSGGSSSSSSSSVGGNGASENNGTNNLNASEAAPGAEPARGAPASEAAKQSLAEELLAGRNSDGGLAVDTELEADEAFASVSATATAAAAPAASSSRTKRNSRAQGANSSESAQAPASAPRYTVKRLHVDINYNERFYWIGPMQMRQEYQQALERGLPYPILTCVEYLSQDEAGFNWARKYRAAGYYTTMLLWLAASLCALMFCLHCAAPKYGIYAMQALGLLLLCTNLTYATLVPRGTQKLVIPFEGQSVTFRLGWNFWLVLVGGCLSLLVGTAIVIIDKLFPNFIFTTVLDVNFDSSSSRAYFQRKHKHLNAASASASLPAAAAASASAPSDKPETDERHTGGGRKKPRVPPFMRNGAQAASGGSSNSKRTAPSEQALRPSASVHKQHSPPADDSEATGAAAAAADGRPERARLPSPESSAAVPSLSSEREINIRL